MIKNWFSSPCSGNYVKLKVSCQKAKIMLAVFSSPCSGNYVKQRQKEKQNVLLPSVFVPLFGELCKTLPHSLLVGVIVMVFVPLFGELCKT